MKNIQNPLFVFDLDSTITRCELLPVLAREVGLEDELRQRTERAMSDGTDFGADFRTRVGLLRDIPISRARAIAAEVPVFEKIAAFIAPRREKCLIVSGNVDVWIEGLLERLNMQGRCVCSRADVQGDRLLGIRSVPAKGEVVRALPKPFAAVGDGANDVEMLRAADYGIAFGGARTVPDALIAAADFVTDDESELCTLLEVFETHASS